MIFLYISVLLTILLKVSIQVPLESYVNDDDFFNGRLTEEYLYKLGYTNESEVISLVRRNITSIAPYAFVSFIKLRNLTMNYNLFKEITTTTFRGMKSLEILDLHCNLIMRVENNSFIDLTSLTSLDLGCNELGEIYMDTFNGLENTLLRLDFSFDGFVYLDPNIFSKLTELEHLNLFYNRLSTLNSSNYFVNNKKLQNINLTFNPITYFDRNIFRNLTSIIGISLQGNRFRTIDPDVLQGSTNIKYFCLSSDYLYSNFSLNVEGLKNLDVTEILDKNCETLLR
jgi:netrin-G3 ligand